MSREHAVQSRPHLGGGHARPRPSPPLVHRALSAAVLASAVLVLALLVWIALGPTMAPWQARSAGSAHGTTLTAAAIDPRLIVRPRTEAKVAEVGGLRLLLAVHPVLPGPNRLVVTPVERGRALVGARVRVVATMLDMLMRPERLETHEERGGRYVGTAALSMFGRWRLAVSVQRPRGAPLTHTFTVNVDLPAALLQAVASARDHTDP